jgi:hypothetical protein
LVALAGLLQQSGIPTLPYFVAGVAALAASLVFWIHHDTQSFDWPFLKFADLVIFVFLPTIFLLVKTAHGSQKLTEPTGAPTIPLKLLFARLADWVATIFPKDR